MDIGKAFSFVAEDEEWLTKIGIGALISLLSFLILPVFLLVGYVVQVTRNVKNGEPRPLPAWTEWEKLFMDGLYVGIAQIVYTLPFWLLMCLAIVTTVGFGGLTGASEDAAILPPPPATSTGRLRPASIPGKSRHSSASGRPG